MDRTDEQLLKAFAEGDSDALGVLAERYECALLDLSTAILRSRDLALDAVQETWFRVVRYAGGFDGRSSVKTWLYRIAINQCRGMLASRPAPNDDLPKQDDDGSDDPSDRAVERDETAHLKRAVEKLSPPLRETILLCYTHGMAHAEAAQAMEIPVGTVKSRLHAALETLREMLSAGR